MKGRVNRGSGAGGLLRYLMDEGPKRTGLKQSEIVGGTFASANAAGFTREMTALHRLRPDIERHVWHCSLALPAGERLSAAQWDAVATDFMREMEFPEDTGWVAIRHSDTDHDHIHIVASRISLSGKVWLGKWEAIKAIQATQELEKRHGLTVTKGLYDDEMKRRPDDQASKKLTPGEINQAVRTGEEPLRQRLQKLVDAAVKGGPNAVEFAELLTLAGVGVRANVASTGRMNGFSFELEGVAFKGSDLGKTYTWQGLQARGVTYEQARDSKGLEHFKQPTAVTNSGSDPAVAGSDGAGQVVTGNGDGKHGESAGSTDSDREKDRSEDHIDGASDGVTARSGGEGAERGIGAAGEDQGRRASGAGVLREGAGSTAQVAGRDVGRDVGAGSEGVHSEGGELGQAAERADGIGQADHSGGEQPAPVAGATDERSGDHGYSEPADGRSSAVDPAATLEAANDADTGSGAGRRDGSGNAGDWAKRFKIASADKRRSETPEQLPIDVGQGHKTGARVDAGDRKSAREVDPTHFLESHGFDVKRDGAHLSARQNGDEVYRLTLKQDGHWLWCDTYGNEGGDNIDLVKEVTGVTGYAEAVYELVGKPHLPRQSQSSAQVKPRTPPTVPRAGYGAEKAGRDYLIERGIPLAIIEQAESQQMVQYAAGCVFFVGHSYSGDGQPVRVESATRRATDPDDPVQRRDLKGSDKRFPGILLGDPGNVWIVEGGVDALALHAVYARRGDPVPTVIVSGGSNVSGFLESPHIQEILRSAERVTIAGENEKDEKTQAKTDAARGKQAERIVEITGADVRLWTPKPESGKDLGEYNVGHAASYKRQQAELDSTPTVDVEFKGLS